MPDDIEPQYELSVDGHIVIDSEVLYGHRQAGLAQPATDLVKHEVDTPLPEQSGPTQGEHDERSASE